MDIQSKANEQSAYSRFKTRMNSDDVQVRLSIRNYYQSKMRLGLLIAFVLSLFIVFFLVIGLGARRTYLNEVYGNEMRYHELALELKEAELIAHYNGHSKQLEKREITRIMESIKLDDRQIVLDVPNIDAIDTILLELSNGASISIAKDPSYTGRRDRSIVLYQYEDREVVVSFEDYNLFERALRWIEA